MKKAVWASQAIAIVALLIFSFQAFVMLDQAQAYGTRSSFVIERIDAASKDSARQAINSIAQDLHINIFKEQAQRSNSFYGRTLFVFTGDAQGYAAIYGSGYPNFSAGSFSTQLADQDQLDSEDLRGNYFISAGPGTLQQVLDLLEQNNIVAHGANVSFASAVLLAVGRTHMAASIAVSALAAALALVFWVAQNRKVYALKKIHGYRAASNFGSALKLLTCVFVALVLPCTAVLVLLMGWINHFAQLGRYLLLVLALLGSLYVALALVTLLAVALFSHIRVPRVIKGEKPAIKLGVIAGMAQMLVMVLCITSLTTSLARLDSISSSLEVAGVWTQDEPLYVLRLSVTGTHEDDEKTAPVLASLVEDFEAQGKALLSHLERHPQTSDAYAIGGACSLLVNNEYLSRQQVLDSNGEAIVPVSGDVGSFTLLVPESYTGDVDALASSYEQALTQDSKLGRSGAEAVAAHAQVLRTQAGQLLPTYGQTADQPVEYQRQASLEDPVIAVVPAASGLIAPLTYLSYASQGSLLFEDYSLLESALASAGVMDAFQGIDNAADSVLRSIRNSQQEQLIDRMNIGFASVVLVFCLLVLAGLYCERQKKINFVRLIHGYRFIRRHAGYLLLTGLICVLSAHISLVLGGTYTPATVGAALGSALLAWLVSLTFLRHYERSYRADYIKQG